MIGPINRIDWSTYEIEPARGAWLLPLQKVIDFYPRVYEEAKRDILSHMAILDAHLLSTTYLVGNTITLADIVVAMSFVDLWRNVLPHATTKGFINFTRWFNTLINQSQWKSVLGEVIQANIEAQPPVVAASKKQSSSSSSSKQPKAKAKANTVPSSTKPKSPPPENDGPHYEKKRPPNPLDHLPRSSMILDNVKKAFFSRPAMIETMFNTTSSGGVDETTRWDNAGYSAYICNYKYDDEHRVTPSPHPPPLLVALFTHSFCLTHNRCFS